MVYNMIDKTMPPGFRVGEWRDHVVLTIQALWMRCGEAYGDIFVMAMHHSAAFAAARNEAMSHAEAPGENEFRFGEI
ncbi:hypothetical protein AA106556_1928 [Neokomagataea tanensis NBRC 106556]|uniref:Uncharacterized protein n=1 Tax=Neokomagataea tanensis NBRC 106556 TaxID=1223519 RepID=A0ABQ0QL93_9PROT|nr:hypothetical protein AA106556_1928 [Neokomagataea tanensis NBRC 106556]